MMMLLSEDVKPINYLKTKMANVIKTVNETKRAIIVMQNGKAKALI